MLNEMPNLALLPDIDITPRVFVKQADGEYLEVMHIQSFERSDFQSKENNVSFAMEGLQSEALSDLLNNEDQEVDVKLEFSLGAVMVMTFSGQVVEFTGERLTIAMQTPITTEVLEESVTLH